ncbi:hypothetical protein [Novosphingobium sp. KA1]|uniref:hypothetical protein n=1 Tax=Novosphingobium sp. (strain KA1) TaxID=164608 RepID=UPI001A8FAB9B|nr:hypothetical protein [Novosphingobium sp. KA1]QSR15646.1 hypothetical protein CA833_00230 [Novosphingobium sp. KA1]
MSAPLDHREIRAIVVELSPVCTETQRLTAFARQAEKVAMRCLITAITVLGSACVVAQIAMRLGAAG